MAILIGIDEAGYGPILGPLVVSAAVFEVADKEVGKSLWEVLGRSVARRRNGSNGRILVNDSKKLHKGKGKYDDLQRGVLSFLAAAEDKDNGRRHQGKDNDDDDCHDGRHAGAAGVPETLGALLERLGMTGTGTTGTGTTGTTGMGTTMTGTAAKTKMGVFDDYPWYSGQEGRALTFARDDIATAGNALRVEMAEKGIGFHGLWSRVLPAGAFNEMVAAVNNKATVLFGMASELMDRGRRVFGGKDVQIVIDKQGGREHYREQLQRIFPRYELGILKEDGGVSSYRLSGEGRTIKVHFLEKGDSRQLPVALASMTSKYVRELFMEALNDYFTQRCRGLKPTAGYYTDGKRFLGDLADYACGETETHRQLLVRQR